MAMAARWRMLPKSANSSFVAEVLAMSGVVVMLAVIMLRWVGVVSVFAVSEMGGGCGVRDAWWLWQMCG